MIGVRESLHAMAVELNNTACELHIRGDLVHACRLYKDSYDAIKKSLQFPASSECGPSTPVGEQNKCTAAQHQTCGNGFRPTPIFVSPGNMDSNEVVTILLHNMGLGNCDRGSVDTAITLLKTASSLMINSQQRENSVHLQAWVSVHFTLGAIYSRLNNHEESQAWFIMASRFVRVNRRCCGVSAGLLNRIGQRLLETGQISGALQSFQRASEVSGESGNTQDTYPHAIVVEDVAAAAA